MAARVREAQQLVFELEALPSVAWNDLMNHPRHIAFLREYHRAKCLTNLWYHLRFAVYFKAMKHYSPTLHGEDGVCGWLQKWSQTHHGLEIPVHIKMLIMAREHCKTQLGIAYDSWMFARDPNNRLLIRGYKDPKAYEILSGLKQLLKHPTYMSTYPWVRPMCNSKGAELKWAEEAILLDRDDLGVRVPSVEACGIKGDPTGGHFTMGHYDDYEVRSNANSDVLRNEMIETFQNDSNLFLAGSKRLFCGTPWGKNGLIQQVRLRKGVFENHNYDILEQAAEVQVRDKLYSGSEPVLLPDRQTFRCAGAGFPTQMDNLHLCQAKLRFFEPAHKVVIEEIREVEWNDTHHFRVNRPLPTLLGQPLAYVIGNMKPACPERFTLDSMDLEPPIELLDTHIPRKSLVEKRRDQGSTVYSAQMLLKPIDPESMLLNPELYHRITASEMPEGTRAWYRAADFATKKKTRASTAIMTAFWHSEGLFITHIVKENQMNNMEKILELLLGELRVRDMGGYLKWTSFEKAAIEETLGDFLEEAEKDPIAFFSARPKYRHYVEQIFNESGPIRITKHTMSRPGMMNKPERLLSIQPLLEAGRIHVVVDNGFVTESNFDALCTETEELRLESDQSFDVLDTLRDIICDGKAPRIASSIEKAQAGLFAETNRKARLRGMLAQQGILSNSRAFS